MENNMANPILEPLDPLLHNRSAIAEGDVFSILSHSPYVVRSFEFALADGVVDCTNTHATNSTFADRHWAIEQANLLSDATSELLPFDVKSSFNFEHHYVSSLLQKRQVAFYICISSADPSFVELIPNYHQIEDLGTFETQETHLTNGENNRNLSINNGRRCILPLRSYRLDPTNAPYRMPINFLPHAISRVRSCARGEGQYINPWTLVEFPTWSPRAIKSTTHIKPARHTSQYTSYKAVMEIYRYVNFSSALTTMFVDVVGLQPRLADFKLILTSTSSPISPTDRCQSTRQVFVQHKIDSRTRCSEDSLNKVDVMRRDRNTKQYWFSALTRFDFFFVQFTFSGDKGMPPRTSFMFLPERLIPDSFYGSSERYQSFHRPEFTPYLLAMDEEGLWVTHVQKIVEANPSPQQPGSRPIRSTARIPGPSPEPNNGLEDDKLSSSGQQAQQSLPDEWPRLHAPLLKDPTSTSVMRTIQTRFFNGLMEQCAQRKSGILIVFSNNHPVCDFGFCRYRWTDHERKLYLRLGKPPRVAHELPASIPTVPICYYTQQAETSFEGPSISSSQFRRLDCCSINKLVLWNLFGPDALSNEELPIVIPSDDISATARQRVVLKSNLQRSEVGFGKPTPTLSALLHRGLFASEYRPTSHGLEGYSAPMWASIWKLLDDFTLPIPLEHPCGIQRQPADYRVPLKVLHQRLAEEFWHHPVEKRQTIDAQ